MSELVKVDVQIALKGGGSENKSKFAMLNPSDSLVDWMLKTMPTMGAGCGARPVCWVLARRSGSHDSGLTSAECPVFGCSICGLLSLQ